MEARSRESIRLLLVPGSTCRHSTNLAALRTAHELAREGLSTDLFTGLAGLPLFSPDDDYEPLPARVIELRRRIALADGVLFSTPEYMGTVPGSFKNLLEWTVGGPEMDGKPVSWINVAPAGRGDGAQGTLESVLGYLAALPMEPAGRRVFVPRNSIGADGRIEDAQIRAEIEDAVLTFARQLSGLASAVLAESLMQLRIARHTERLEELVRFYRDGVGLREVGHFRDHAGYVGVFLAVDGSGAHLEFTAGGGEAPPDPHPESLVVLYLGDDETVRAVRARLGVDPVAASNPYWDEHGVTVEDPDGFRVVLVPEHWQG